jgi:hypothetical protein
LVTCFSAVLFAAAAGEAALMFTSASEALVVAAKVAAFALTLLFVILSRLIPVRDFRAAAVAIGNRLAASAR